MKKIISMFVLVILMFACQLWAVTVSHTDYHEWIYRSETINVVKITIPADGITADESAIFEVKGMMALRIVIDVTAVDADGDITITDETGVAYFSLSNGLGIADVDYIIPSVDQNANTYGGVPVVGTQTVRLTDFAAAAPITIYIYYSK